MPWRRAVLVVLLSVVIAAACSDSDEAASTTQEAPATTAPTTRSTVTSAPSSGVTASSSSTPSSAPAATSTTIAPAQTIPVYSIEARTVGDNGDTVVVLLAPGTYSDLDLENVVADVVQRFAPIATVHVVDDPTTVPLVLDDVQLDATQRATLDEHYFARLEEGFRLVFVGPFQSFPEVILGS